MYKKQTSRQLLNHDLFKTLEDSLGYKFESKKLIEQALTRRSAINSGIVSYSREDNQRLEFLGDKVLGLAVSELLYLTHPNWNEERLTSQTSYYVRNDNMLPRVAKDLDLGEYLIMDRGEEINNRGRNNPKILADSLEALFGAIYLDSGRNLNIVKALIIKHWYNLDLAVIDNPNKDREINWQVRAFHTLLASDEKMLEAMLIVGLNPNTIGTVGSYFKFKQPIDYDDFKSEDTISAAGNRINNGDTLLVAAIRAEDYKIIQLLLKYKADPNMSVQLGLFNDDLEIWYPSFPLMITLGYFHSSKKQKECINSLINHGANVNLKDLSGNTALLAATTTQNKSAFKALMADYSYEALKNLNITNRSGMNALHCAAMIEDTWFIDRLLAFGMNINVRNNEGKTPLHYAVMSKKLEVINHLIAGGATAHLNDSNLNKQIQLIKKEELSFKDRLSIIDSRRDLMSKYGNKSERRDASTHMENTENCRVM